MPWNNRIAIHTLENGNIEMTPVRITPPEDKLKLT